MSEKVIRTNKERSLEYQQITDDLFFTNLLFTIPFKREQLTNPKPPPNIWAT